MRYVAILEVMLDLGDDKTAATSEAASYAEKVFLEYEHPGTMVDCSLKDIVALEDDE